MSDLAGKIREQAALTVEQVVYALNETGYEPGDFAPQCGSHSLSWVQRLTVALNKRAVSREVVLGLVADAEAQIRTEENKWWLERMPAGLWIQDIREHVASAERQMKRGSE